MPMGPVGRAWLESQCSTQFNATTTASVSAILLIAFIVRSSSGKRKGVTYSQYSLCESVRRGSQSSRRKLLTLGSKYDFPREKWP